jgi:hypothetical protein
MIALEMSLRGLLRNFDLKVGAISRGKFEARTRWGVPNCIRQQIQKYLPQSMWITNHPQHAL